MHSSCTRFLPRSSSDDTTLHDCSGKTRLALHVPSSHELESVNIIIIIIIMTAKHAASTDTVGMLRTD